MKIFTIDFAYSLFKAKAKNARCLMVMNKILSNNNKRKISFKCFIVMVYTVNGLILCPLI